MAAFTDNLLIKLMEFIHAFPKIIDFATFEDIV